MDTTLITRKIGRYRLEERLGVGGMAEVHRAVDTRLDRAVAIKTILPALASQPRFLERFLREARIVAALEHPHIVGIYDFGEQDGTPFLVMPCIDGGTLAERIGENGVTTVEAADWVMRIAEALDDAHAAGVLHRDVKPGNVLMDRHGRPLLSDFGLARHHGVASDLTATGVLLGTPLYMAPELAEGRPASPASDLYALAVMAYEMLGGAPPFRGDSPMAVLHQHVNTPVPPITGRVAELPASLNRVFAQALSKDPTDRPGSCRAFATMFVACLERRAATRSTMDADRAAGPFVREGGTPVTPSSSRPRLLGVALGALILMALMIVWGAGRTREAVPSESPPVQSAPPPASEPHANSDRAPSTTRSTPNVSLRRLAQRFRRPRKLTAANFEVLGKQISAALEEHASTPMLEAMRVYAEGGQAYASGDDSAARAAVEHARSLVGESSHRDQAPAGLVDDRRDARPIEDWELAVIFGDARGEGGTRVDDALRVAPSDPRVRFGQAQMQHIAEDHDRALATAVRVRDGAHPLEPEFAATVSRFADDELAEIRLLHERATNHRTGSANTPRDHRSK